MSKIARKEEMLVKRKLDLQLDRELEDTFPASDALKITRPRAVCSDFNVLTRQEESGD